MILYPLSKDGCVAEGLADRLPGCDNLSILELARHDRLVDARVLERNERRTGAIYLLGYFVEMTLKIAFFRIMGFKADEPITLKDLRTVADLARDELAIRESPRGFHSFVFWTRAIVELCEHFDQPLPSEFTLELAYRSQRMSSSWSPSLRYSHDIANAGDWESLLIDVEWIDGVDDELFPNAHSQRR